MAPQHEKFTMTTSGARFPTTTDTPSGKLSEALDFNLTGVLSFNLGLKTKKLRPNQGCWETKRFLTWGSFCSYLLFSFFFLFKNLLFL